MRFNTTIDLSKEFYPVPKPSKTEKNRSGQLKKKSNKLAKLERNRFSIITDDLKHCYICTERGIKNIPKEDLHEVYGGRNRRRSIENGLVVPLCRKCHQDKKMLEWLKRFVQLEYEETHTRKQFIELIGRNYLGEEKKMRMSAIAKHKNKTPKENSKTQIDKRKNVTKNYRPRICCEMCKESNTTLYSTKGKYYCVKCKDKQKNK